MSQQHIDYSFPNDGLGDTLRESWVKQESNNTELYNQKVDKVVGQGLSDTNFTQVEKDKLASLDPAFQEPTDWDETNPSSPKYLENKPENTSDFNNDGESGTPFIVDVVAAGQYVREAGAWVLLSDATAVLPFDENITVDNTQVFTLPPGRKPISVHLNGAPQFPLTANNASRPDTWTQLADDITLLFPTVSGDYVCIIHQ